MKHTLKLAICSYLAAMAFVSSAEAKEPVTVNVPLTCFPGEDIVKGYAETGTFKPLLVAQNEASGAHTLALYVDPSDGELHVWVVIGDAPCLIDKTMLRGVNLDVLKGKML